MIPALRLSRADSDQRITPNTVPLSRRFWTKVQQSETCWLWTAATTHDGYGFIHYYSHEGVARVVYAHRYAYETHVGPIPEGLQIDHLCRVRHCVNPAHLEVVTHRENMARSTAAGAHAFRTGRCLRGHDKSDAYVNKDGGLQCRTCTRDRARARWRRLNGKASS